MSLSFCVLGSGSAGNCTLVSFGVGDQCRHVLIDAGLSPRATARRLEPLNVRVDQIDAIFLTHLDFDHFHRGWLKAIHRYSLRTRLLVHQRHRRAAWRSGMNARCTEMYLDLMALDHGARVSTVLLAHDDVGSVGFVIEYAGLRLGYATDLGRVPECLFERFVNLNALAIESNYDRAMQLASNRPGFLKRRIMGGAGHLSNEQAIDAVHRIAQSSRLSHVALLHLSRQCNDPALVQSLYARRLPAILPRLTIADQHQPTARLDVACGPDFGIAAPVPMRQMSLFEVVAGQPAMS